MEAEAKAAEAAEIEWAELFEDADDKERADLLMVIQGYKSLDPERKRALKAWLDDAICGE